MGVFVFQAKDTSGKILKGEVEAANEVEARVKVRSQQLIPLKVVPKQSLAGTESKKNFFSGGGIKPKELQVFTRQFSVLIGAGVPIVQSLDALMGPGRSPRLNKAIEGVLSDVERGQSLASSMGKFPEIFDKMYVNLILAGEEGGVLDTVLLRLASYIEKSVKLKSKIMRGLWYPGAIVFVACLVISAILIFVIPTFVEMFSQLGKELPALTRMVINVSGMFQTYWYLVLGGLFGGPIALSRYHKSTEGRKVVDKLLLSIPIFGVLVRKGAIARFSRTLSTLLAAGVRLMESLEIAASTSGNYLIENDLISSKESISRGRTMAEPLRKSEQIPDMVAQMIEVGEQTGNIDVMLEKIADFYEDEVEGTAEAISSLIEPILMVVLGGVIALLVGAMYLPVFDIASVVGGV